MIRWDPFLDALKWGDYAEIYAEDSRGTSVQYEDGRVDEVESGRSVGMGLRYLEKEETRFGHVDGWDASPLRNLSSGLAAGFRKRAERFPSPEPVERHHPIAQDPFQVSLEEKVRRLETADRAVRALPEAALLRQVSLTYGEREKLVCGISFEKDGSVSAFNERRVYLVFAATVVAGRDGLLQTATEVSGALCGLELFDRDDPVQIALRAARRAVRKLAAPPAPLGEMPVILESQAGGTMIHEAIGHSLEADGVQKGVSPVYKGKVGAVVAGPKITVYDDPTLSGHRGSFAFDDEGTPAERTVLVEKGVLKTYLYDRLSAGKDGRGSNGHGRRESYRHKPIPRMSNTFIAPGPDDPAAVLQSVPEGLLVRRMGGGQVNPVTGDFVFEVEEGYLLKGGQTPALVRGASLLGNGPQVLSAIDLVGRDMGWGVGTCGKDGQGVPVSDGQPTLRIPKLLIGGQAA